MPASNIYRQTKLIKSRNRLPGSVCRQTKRGKSKYVCQVQVVSADRINKNKKMSASHHLSRQIKQEKRRKCLPVSQFGGRQKQGNPESVCQPQIESADKTREKKKMSASPTIWWQTKARKSGKCLPATNEVGRQNKRKEANVCQSHNLVADKSKEIRSLSASHKLSRQTKQEKRSKCLPVSQFAGRQSQENQENICQLQNLPADRIKKL